MAKTKYDEILLGILKEEAHLYPFLDVVFGFLYRCTDFYEIQNSPDDKLGFPVGIAQNIVSQVFKKWENAAIKNKEYSEPERSSTDVIPPPVAHEEVVVEENVSDSTAFVLDESESNKKPNSNERSIQKRFQCSDASYNGAVRDGYQWSQSISDIDVQVTVPPHVRKGRNVKVDISSSHVSVTVLKEDAVNEWQTIFEGELSFPTNKDESVWSLVPGSYIQIHLEKQQERWWDALFTSESKINLQEIDASRPMEDLPQEEQMKIQELIWNQERKLQGLPTSENMSAFGSSCTLVEFGEHGVSSGGLLMNLSNAGYIYINKNKMRLLNWEIPEFPSLFKIIRCPPDQTPCFLNTTSVP